MDAIQSENPVKTGIIGSVALSDLTREDSDLSGMAGVVEISGCLDSSAAMEAVVANEFEGLVVIGEPDFIGSAGEGDTVDSVLSHYGQSIAQAENDLWEYYKSTVAGASKLAVKAWLHWNGTGFDAYLRCRRDTEGDSGFASHDMPYVQ